MGGPWRVLLVALLAAALGLAASLLSGPGGWTRTSLGQTLLARILRASAPPPPAGTPVAQVGQPVAPLRLPDLAGQVVALPGHYAGRPLLVNVWAPWCAPCVREMPVLQAFSAEQAGNGVQVVGIALDDRIAVEAFLQRVPVRYAILLDQAGPADASVRLGDPNGVLPYSVLISADGRLLKQRIGPFAEGELAGWAASAAAH